MQNEYSESYICMKMLFFLYSLSLGSSEINSLNLICLWIISSVIKSSWETLNFSKPYPPYAIVCDKLGYFAIINLYWLDVFLLMLYISTVWLIWNISFLISLTISSAFAP